MNTPVRVENLTVQFDGFKALDDVTHTFEPGTSTAVMGVNGSGKTTLLETIAGLIRPVSGRIDGVGERLAYVCQHPPTTWMPLTASEVLAMGRYRERGLIGRFRAGDRAAMHSAAERLHINHLLQSSFGELSGGQQQRVRIAQMLASDPPMFTEQRLRQAFGERMLGDHAHHTHAHDMIVLDDHGHQSHPGHDHTDTGPTRGFDRSPRETH